MRCNAWPRKNVQMTRRPRPGAPAGISAEPTLEPSPPTPTTQSYWHHFAGTGRVSACYTFGEQTR